MFIVITRVKNYSLSLVRSSQKRSYCRFWNTKYIILVNA